MASQIGAHRVHRNDDYVNDGYVAVKRVSWSAIFAGTLAALAVTNRSDLVRIEHRLWRNEPGAGR